MRVSAVDHLDDGLAAEEFLRTESCDVIIIDVNLPGLTGIELTRRLRQRGDATPVLMLTAMGKTSDRVAGLDAGADDYLVKPFEMAELLPGSGPCPAAARRLRPRSKRPAA
ncbi:response regulator [Pannonibacter sp. Pt2-lr]